MNLARKLRETGHGGEKLNTFSPLASKPFVWLPLMPLFFSPLFSHKGDHGIPRGPETQAPREIEPNL